MRQKPLLVVLALVLLTTPAWAQQKTSKPTSTPATTTKPAAAKPAAAATFRTFCFSDLDQPIVYVSQSFDTHISHAVPEGEEILDLAIIQIDFADFLINKYGYTRTKRETLADCIEEYGSRDASEAQQRRSAWEVKERAAGKKIVETTWVPAPDPDQRAQPLKEGRDPVAAGNPRLAMQKFLEASRQGSSDADYEIGRLYRSGQGVDQSHNEALYWFERAANGGNLSAMTMAGIYYASGLGIAANPGKAAQWFAKPVEQGDPIAQYGLGMLYRDGRGVPRDLKKALALFRQSAEDGTAFALAALADLYLTGEGVEKSALNAYIQATLAFDRGATLASVTRDAAAKQLTPAQLEQAKVEIARNKARWK